MPHGYKDNRLVALTETDKNEGRYVWTRAPEGIGQLELADRQAVRGWMKGFSHEVFFIRRAVTNKDGSTGLLNRVCSDLACDGGQDSALHQKR